MVLHCSLLVLSLLHFGRNLSLLEKSFFTERFTPEFIRQMEQCGVRLAVDHPWLLLLGF